MTWDQFISSLHTAVERLPHDLFRSYVAVAGDVKQMIANRIIETGINDKGVSLAAIRDYSEKYKRFKTNPPPSAGMKNRYRGFVDLQLTGAMWGNIKVNVNQSRIDKTSVRINISPTDTFNKAKAEKNAEKWGDFIAASAEEEFIAAENLEIEVVDLFNSYFP